MSILVEVCAGSLEDCIIAEAAGADRIELNSALALGGLTPSAGLLKTVLEKCALPIIMMLRPRSGGFAYSEGEFATMKADLMFGKELGITGFAFGIFTDSGKLDYPRCQELIELADDHETVLHRAFDLLKNPDLEKIIDLGFDRILTSGKAATAWAGRDYLKELVEKYSAQIGIVAASGVNIANAHKLVNFCGLREIHGTFSSDSMDITANQNQLIDFTSKSAGEIFRTADFDKISEIIKTFAK